MFLPLYKEIEIYQNNIVIVELHSWVLHSDEDSNHIT